MASLGLRSAARVLRRSISDSAWKSQPNKQSCSKFSTGHGKHIGQEKSTPSQPVRPRTSIMEKLDEHSRLLRATREDLQLLLQQADANIAWDRLQKRVMLPSVALVALAFYAGKMLFGESTEEMPGKSKPPC